MNDSQGNREFTQNILKYRFDSSLQVSLSLIHICGAVQTHMKYGTTSIFPTLSSSTVPMLEQAAETCTKMMAEKDSPILGLHLDGHYLNMAMAGGQLSLIQI